MMRRLALGLVLLGPFVLPLAPIDAQAPPSPAGAAATPRAIRRDLPITNSIQRAYDAGTRDMTGRPGPNYWQLQTDFDIRVRLDPDTQTLTGTETITVHNNSPQELNELVLRLDHNIFRGLVPRGMSVPAENTDGMVVTRLVVNGEAVDLDGAGRSCGPRPRRRRPAAPFGVRPRPDRRACRAREANRREVVRRNSRSTGERSCRAAPAAAAIV